MQTRLCISDLSDFLKKLSQIKDNLISYWWFTVIFYCCGKGTVLSMLRALSWKQNVERVPNLLWSCAAGTALTDLDRVRLSYWYYNWLLLFSTMKIILLMWVQMWYMERSLTVKAAHFALTTQRHSTQNDIDWTIFRRLQKTIYFSFLLLK